MRAALEAGLARAGQTLTPEQTDRLCEFGGCCWKRIRS